jgi:hypothetical protein
MSASLTNEEESAISSWMPAVVPCATPKGVVALWHSATALCHWHPDGTPVALALAALDVRERSEA